MVLFFFYTSYAVPAFGADCACGSMVLPSSVCGFLRRAQKTAHQQKKRTAAPEPRRGAAARPELVEGKAKITYKGNDLKSVIRAISKHRSSQVSARNLAASTRQC